MEIQSKLQKAIQLKNDNQFQESLQILYSINCPSLNRDDQYTYYFLKNTILLHLGKYQDALKIADEILSMARSQQNTIKIIDALLASGISLRNLEQYEQFSSRMDECEILLQNINELPEKEIGLRKIKFCNLMGNYNWHLGKMDLALKYHHEYLEICQRYGDPLDIARAYGNLALIEPRIDVAIDYIHKSNEIFKNSDNLYGLATNYLNLGYFYELQGNLNQSLQYYENCLQINQKLKNQKGIALALGNIASIYYEKGELAEALQYINQTLTLQTQFSTNYEQSSTLLDLLLIYLEQGDLSQAEDVIKKIKSLHDKKPYPRVYQQYLLAYALLLKKHGRPYPLIQALHLLLTLVKKNGVDNELLRKAFLSLCDIYIKLLHITNDTEFIDEIDPLLEKLLSIASLENSNSLKAEITFLKAKLQLLDLNIQKAQTLYTEALHIAQTYHITRLSIKISADYDAFLQNIELWQEYHRKKVSKFECMELLSLESDLDHFITKKEWHHDPIQPEIPLLLLIMSKSGQSLFNYFFDPKWEEKSLFTPFMSAFNAFSTELFAQSIDRIKIHDNTILISDLDSLMILYVIKGQSYLAQQKLEQFVNEMQGNADIFVQLENSRNKGEILTRNKAPLLYKYVHAIFGAQDQKNKK